MEKNNEIIRIADIAKMAGVSVGTVDRVIHNRGRVSEENLKKIKEVLDKVNYRPNVMARSLATKKQFHIGALIPAFEHGQYWEALAEGIDKAAKELKSYNTYITQFHFDQYNQSSFDEMADKLLSAEIDGAVIATQFTDQVTVLSARLDEAEIPYTYVDSNIPSNNQIGYFGTESYQCGTIAAKLLIEKIPDNSDILITRISNNGNFESTQRKNRRQGFLDFLEKNNFKGNIHQVELKLNDLKFNTKVLGHFFEVHPNIKGITVFNSTCYLAGEYIRSKNIKDKILIGYDSIEKNAALLSQGIITALIAQRPKSQGYFGTKAISNYLLLKQKPEAVNLMPIDILIKENIDYYINNKL